MTKKLDHERQKRRIMQMVYNDVLMVIDHNKLHEIDPALEHDWLNSEDYSVLERIDEEGCGAFFAAITERAWKYK